MGKTPLDGALAEGVRLAPHAQSPKPRARALQGPKTLDVNLRPEDLVEAAHDLAPIALVDIEALTP